MMVKIAPACFSLPLLIACAVASAAQSVPCGLSQIKALRAVTRDQGLAEAIDIVQSSRRSDGRWRLQNRYKGRTYFELERFGAPSRWKTLRALQVLKWWELGT